MADVDPRDRARARAIVNEVLVDHALRTTFDDLDAADAARRELELRRAEARDAALAPYREIGRAYGRMFVGIRAIAEAMTSGCAEEVRRG